MEIEDKELNENAEEEMISSENKMLNAMVLTEMLNKHYFIDLDNGLELRLELKDGTTFRRLWLMSNDSTKKLFSIERKNDKEFVIKIENDETFEAVKTDKKG